MAPVEPAYARKLLHDLTVWARSQGFSPHRDYAKIESLFGAVDAAACDTAFEFGDGGKPVLIERVSETIWGSIEYSDDHTIEGEVSEAGPLDAL